MNITEIKRVVLAKSIYSVDTISKGNPKPWNKFMEYMKEQALGEDEPILFDFKGIEVIQPWLTAEFKIFMQDNRVYIKVWNSGITANTINIMCKLGGIDDDRAFNEDIKTEKVLTPEEKKIQTIANEMQKYFSIENGVHTLCVYKRFDQIGSSLTVAYIEEAVRIYANNTGEKHINIDFKNKNVEIRVIERVTQMFNTLGADNIEINIICDDKEIMNKVSMYKNLSGNKECSNADKLKIIKAELTPGSVGMLIKYKESKAIDEFGRKGKGQPISSRVAIYKGMKKKSDGEVCLLFTTYVGNTFYTRAHWALEHDNEVLKSIETIVETVPVSQLGLYNNFLGSKFHFIAPIQIKEKDTMVMYGLDPMGRTIQTKLTIPERIKVVFDDWGISYDEELLQQYIKVTREELKKQNGGN